MNTKSITNSLSQAHHNLCLVSFLLDLLWLEIGLPHFLSCWKSLMHNWRFSVQFSSVTQSVRLCNPLNCSTPGLPVHHQLPEFTQTHVHWVGDAIQPSHPLSSPSPPAFNLSQHQGLFQWVSSFHQVAKYWSFSFSISPSNEYSGLISFRIDWFDIAVQQTLKSLIQHHSSKASVLRHSASSIILTSIHDYRKNHSYDNAQSWMWLVMEDSAHEMIDIIWYFCFSAWLTSLRMTISGFVHVAAKGMTSFFLMAE